jgi:hypothetical protein
LDRLGKLVGQAKTILSGDPDRTSMWRAYVALEYAIMDLKLRHNLEGEAAPETRTKQAIDIVEARLMLARIDVSSDTRKLLYDLRSCRDVVKALVANYDRRSTTS